MEFVNGAEGKPVRNENELDKSVDNTIKSSDENVQQQSFKTVDKQIGGRNVEKEERANGGPGLGEKISDTIEFAKASKNFLYYLNKLQLLWQLISIWIQRKIRRKEIAKDVLKETKEADKSVGSAEGAIKDADEVVEGAKKVVECVETKVQVWMDVNKKLYDKAVDDNEKLRNDIQQQIKKLEDNEKSRQETNDGLIKEFDDFIDQTKKEFEALVKDFNELDELLKSFDKCNEDDKQSHFEKIQEKQAALINKFTDLQNDQLKFLTEFRSKLSNACEVITQQNKDLIEELRKIAESNEDHDTVLKQAEEEYNAVQQKYEKIKKDHESWMPAIGWTRPTEEDVKNAEQEFLRKAAKLNILKGIGDNDIQTGLRSVIDDLDEIKQHHECAIKDLNDARGHLDSVMKTVNKVRKLTAIFSFDFDLNSAPVKAGLIGIVGGFFIAVVAGCTAGPTVGIMVGCGLAGAALGKAIGVINPDGEENGQIVGNESSHDNDNDNSVNEDELADGQDDLGLLSYDIRKDPIEEDVRDQSQKVQNVAEDKQDSDAKQTDASEQSADNVGVNDDIVNVVEFDDDDLEPLPQDFDQAVIDENVMAHAQEIAASQPTNEFDKSNDNVGVLGAIGGAAVNLGKGAVNAAVGVVKGAVSVVANVGGAAVKAGKTAIGGCVGFVSNLWHFGKGKQSNVDE